LHKLYGFLEHLVGPCHPADLIERETLTPRPINNFCGETQMKSPRYFALAVVVLLISMLTFQSCKKDSDNPVDAIQTEATIGVLTTTPNVVLVSNPTTIQLRLTVPANVKLYDSTVKAYSLDAAGDNATLLGQLYDDGLLSHFDDIKGDNIYNNSFNFTATTTGTVNLRASASTQQGAAGNSNAAPMSVYSNLTTTEYQTIVQTQDSAATKLSQFLAGNPSNLATAVAQLKTWLQGKPGVQSITSGGSSSISILYTSGLYGGLFINEENASGTVLTRGGADLQSRRTGNRIPLSRQTVGTASPARLSKSAATGDLDPKIIGNRSVLIYAPFEAAFSPANEGGKIQTVLQSSGFQFDITYLSNQAATVASLNNLTAYGFVVLATHGSLGKEFATGELVDTNSVIYKNSYKALIKAGKLAIWKNMTISSVGAVKVQGNVYVIRSPFISDLTGTFSNSVVLNNSCESTMNPDLQNAFIGKGAKTYYGYTKVVSSTFCVLNADTLTKRLAKDLKTTGESFMAGSDPGSQHAVFEIKGANDVRYPDSLINGDFEFGKIDGWTRSGDGRVITQLGSVSPTGGSYMGIISTGLGFTTSTGSIFQTFTIKPNQSTLTVKWNFLSEEFLEYIGSQYQDYFQIAVRDQNGAETVLLSRTVDAIASSFGATKESPGTLINASPGITFDEGGVYMTGWQTSNLNVSAFTGKRITLVIRAGDVGDSVYDTAILIDDVSVK